MQAGHFCHTCYESTSGHLYLKNAAFVEQEKCGNWLNVIVSMPVLGQIAKTARS